MMKKNLILLFCLAAFSMFACETPDTPITKEQLPQTAQSFINLYFNDVQIAYIQKDNDSYDVKFSNGFEVDFDEAMRRQTLYKEEEKAALTK